MALIRCGGSNVTIPSGIILKSINIDRGTTGSQPATYGFTAHMANENDNTVTFSAVGTISAFQSLVNCSVTGAVLTVTDPTLDFSFTGKSSGDWVTDITVS